MMVLIKYNFLNKSLSDSKYNARAASNKRLKSTGSGSGNDTRPANTPLRSLESPNNQALGSFELVSSSPTEAPHKVSSSSDG